MMAWPRYGADGLVYWRMYASLGRKELIVGIQWGTWRNDDVSGT